VTLPKRKTQNPAIGVKRCGCGDVMTIHRAKGTRAGTLYSICDKCGVDQRNGDTPQAFFADHFDSLEALEAAPALGQEGETEGETGAEIMAVEAANDAEMIASEGESEGKAGAAPFALVAAIVGGLVGLLALAAKLKETPQI
jgi:hypothetical protein